jgi:Histidine kinase-like ATPase domain
MEVGTFEVSADSPADIPRARRMAEMRLEEWGCSPGDDVLLVLSELVTNAVEHAGGAARIVVQNSDGIVTIVVHDANPVAPAMRSRPDESGGFGLRIVDQLTIEWGWTPAFGGKQVWAEVPCPD